MARPPVIGYEDVEEAVRMLQDKGKPINPYQVRSVLGKGSEAKILYYLKGMGLDIEYQDEDPLTKRIVNLVRPVVVELNEQYEEQIRKEKAGLIEELSSERERVKSYRDQLADMSAKLKDETSRADSSLKKIEQLQTELNAERKALAEQKQRTLSLEEKLDSTNTSLKDTKLHLESTKAEHKELVVLLKDEHARTLQGYKEALEQSNRSADRMKAQLEETTTVVSKQGLELTALKERLAEASQREQSFIVQIEQKDRLISEHSSKLVDLSSELEKLSTEIQGHLKTIATLRESDEENIKLKSENAALVKVNDKLSTELDVLKVVIDKLSPRQEDKDKKPE